MSDQDLIYTAITGRFLLNVVYDGVSRMIEPYCYGTSKTGKNLLRAYQLGASASEDGWRLFSVAKLRAISLSVDRFEVIRNDYNARDTAMQIVHCAI